MTRRRLIWSGLSALATIRARAASGEEPRSLKPRLVWSGPEVSFLGGPSPDGAALSIVETGTGNLAVRNLESGETRAIAPKDPEREAGEFAYFSTISRDGRNVAYAWFNDEEFYELRTAPIAGAGPSRTLIRNSESGFVQPCAWSPDDERILTLLFRKDNISQIALISSSDGAVTVLKSLNWVYPKRMDYSPDGRFIVYDNFSKPGAAERDIFVLSSDGSRETTLTSGPSNDVFPVWSRDGRSIVFSSDRSGSAGIWAIGVENGDPVGEPRLLKDDLERVLPLGISRAGDYFYGIRAGATDVFTARFDLSAGKLNADPVKVPSGAPGRNWAPAFSPDGSRLAYFTRRGTENYGESARGVAVFDLGDGKESDVAARLAHIERLSWSPDGASLLVGGSDRRGRGGLYRVEVPSGETELLVHEPDAGFRGLEGSWSGDGTSLYFVRPSRQGGSQIRHWSAESREDRWVYSGKGDLALAAVSPNGEWLAFLESAEGGDALQALNLRTDELRRLIRAPGEVETIEWMPNSERLIAGLREGERAELWNVPVEGGEALRIRLPENWNPDFRVHPDGERVVFTAGRTRSEVWVLEGVAAAAPRRGTSSDSDRQGVDGSITRARNR